MTLALYKVAAALLIFLVSIATVIYPLRKKLGHIHAEPLELGEALASGIFLGAAFFHLLPEAIQTFNALSPTTTYPIPELICIGGFLLMLFLERLSIIHASCHPAHTIPYVLATILIIHSLVEGAALGIGNTFYEAALLFIAIIAHKGSESFALCMTLIRYKLPFPRILLIVIFFSLMTPLGIALGNSVSTLEQAENGAMWAVALKAFAAGTFLYISTLHHIQFHQQAAEESSQSLWEFVCLVVGLVAMAVLAYWV